MDTSVQSYVPRRTNPDAQELLSLGQLLTTTKGFFIRMKMLILAVTGMVMLLALLYCLFATPKYTASAILIIDARGAQQLSDERQPFVDTSKDAAFVDSQVEILKSEQIIQKVVDSQGLANLSEFQKSGRMGSLINAVLPKAWTQKADAQTSDAKNRTAIEAFKDRLSVDRVGLSYAISISYTSENPRISADVANSVAEAFVAEQLAVRFDLSSDAIKWMQGRLEELRSQTLAADRDVQNFKMSKGIIDTSKGLIDEQQISELNSHILEAQQKSIEAESRLARIRDIKNDPARIGSMPDELSNNVLVTLREQYATLQKRYQDLKLKLGPGHESVKKTQSEILHLSSSVQDELSRVSESVKSELQIARANVKMLQSQMTDLQKTWTATNLDLVKMRELETVAQSYHTLYESFLQRFVNTSQQQTFPISESRLITRASPPMDQSSPRRQLIMLASALIGFMLGCLIALLRDSDNTVFRTSDEIENELGLRCLGVLQHVPAARAVGSKVKRPPLMLEDVGAAGAAVELPATVPRLATIVQRRPFSAYAEALRGAKVELELASSGGTSTVIGITSSVGAEGKSSALLNLALLFVQSQRKCLVIDCDLRRPALSGWLGLKAEAGLMHVLNGQKSWSDVLLSAQSQAFDVIPAGSRAAVANTSDFVGSPAMARLLGDLRREYDVILLDLPPVVPVPDVAAISAMVDMFLLLVSWGKTPIQVVKHAMNNHPQIANRVLGVLLSDAKPRDIKRHGGVDAYVKYYRHT